VLYANQSGPALLQALVAFSVQKEQGDAAESLALSSPAIKKVVSLATTRMPYVEAVLENEAMFTVQTPKELANVSIPALTGRSTLGEFVSETVTAQLQPARPGVASRAAAELFSGVESIVQHTRDLGAVKLSLDYLSGRTIGELNIAFRTTLDSFSMRGSPRAPIADSNRCAIERRPASMSAGTRGSRT